MKNNMKLYDFMKISMEDWDTYDTEYDACVTVCYIDEEDAEDNYDKFCIEIMKKVEVVQIVSDSHLVCDWSKLIKNNMDAFKTFTEKHWKYTYEDDKDEFIYQWINEINLYLAGYVSEKFYDTLVEFIDSLKA